MRRFAVIAAAAPVVVLVAGLVAQARSPHRGQRATTVHVIEHATTDKRIDTWKKGDIDGDLLTWHNKVYDDHRHNRRRQRPGRVHPDQPQTGDMGMHLDHLARRRLHHGRGALLRHEGQRPRHHWRHRAVRKCHR